MSQTRANSGMIDKSFIGLVSRLCSRSVAYSRQHGNAVMGTSVCNHAVLCTPIGTARWHTSHRGSQPEIDDSWLPRDVIELSVWSCVWYDSASSMTCVLDLTVTCFSDSDLPMTTLQMSVATSEWPTYRHRSSSLNSCGSPTIATCSLLLPRFACSSAAVEARSRQSPLTASTTLLLIVVFMFTVIHATGKVYFYLHIYEMGKHGTGSYTDRGYQCDPLCETAWQQLFPSQSFVMFNCSLPSFCYIMIYFSLGSFIST